MLSCCPRLSVCPIFSFLVRRYASECGFWRGFAGDLSGNLDTSVKQGARLTGIIGLWPEGPSHRIGSTAISESQKPSRSQLVIREMQAKSVPAALSPNFLNS